MHIQNATLAGGVAIGSAANLVVSPGGALAVGVAAGLLSTCGYAFLMPRLEAAIGLRDTCGVHNLHGMPGVLGGLVAALVAVVAPEANAPVMKFAGKSQVKAGSPYLSMDVIKCVRASLTCACASLAKALPAARVPARPGLSAAAPAAAQMLIFLACFQC